MMRAHAVTGFRGTTKVPFVKLDCGILDSTLWIDVDARLIFITALLMAEPYEAQEPIEAIEIRTMKKLGFVVPKGWYGFVKAAGRGIAQRAGIKQKDGLDALERLAAVELDSRSAEYEGRRMVRVDGGFIILNYIKYRDRDYTAADRQRRYRERLKKRTRDERERDTRNANAVTDDEQVLDEGGGSLRVTSRIAEADSRSIEEQDSHPSGDSSPPLTLSGDPPKKIPDCPHEKIRSLYNDHCTNLPRCKSMTDGRRSALRTRWKEHPALDWWLRYFKYVHERCPFLNGENQQDRIRQGRKPFTADFDWLLRPANMTKVIEQKYEQ